MDIKVYPGKLRGSVQAPPSKSLAHRALICAALAEGVSCISGISGSEDMEATIGCLKSLGAEIERQGSTVHITGIAPLYENGPACGGSDSSSGDTSSRSGDASSGSGDTSNGSAEPRIMDCRESGSTLRFMLPVAAAAGFETEFLGRGKLPERPMTPLASEMMKKGVSFIPDGRDRLPFRIRGKLEPGTYRIPGNVSSQYISGLMFALPLLEEDSDIVITGSLESASYIELTADMLRSFGITVDKTESGYHIQGGQHYLSRDIEVEGDHSNAAFWLAAGVMGSEIEVSGLNTASVQGDRKTLEILQRMGAECSTEKGLVKAAQGTMKGTDVDCSDIPDIVPVLSVAACRAEGETAFLNAGRLRIKESDRLAAMAECLTKLGINVRETQEGLYVTGGELKGGCVLDGHNDHRIVMSSAVAALSCSEPVVITGAEAVAKSYPDFFDVFRQLGGRADVITDR